MFHWTVSLMEEVSCCRYRVPDPMSRLYRQPRFSFAACFHQFFSAFKAINWVYKLAPGSGRPFYTRPSCFKFLYSKIIPALNLGYLRRIYHSQLTIKTHTTTVKYPTESLFKIALPSYFFERKRDIKVIMQNLNRNDEFLISSGVKKKERNIFKGR